MSETGTSPSRAGTEKPGNLNQEQPPAPSSSGFFKKHWRLVLILLLLAAIAGMYGWKQLAVENTRQELGKKAELIITDQNKSFLHLVSIPLVWAVRSEMIRGNYDQINQYLINFVREPHVDEIVLAKPDGTILLATNKRLEGTPIADSYPATVLQVDKTTVSPLGNRGLMAASPVMGINEKLGVIVLVYMPAAYKLE